MDGYSNSVMVALLPINGGFSKLELPHLTLVYAGELTDQPSGRFNEMAKVASLIGSVFGKITLTSMGLDVFGDDEKVTVLRLFPTPELMAMRKLVEQWNASKHPFNPHVTIAPQGVSVTGYPSLVTFDKLAICFGEEKLEFRLGPNTLGG